MPTSKHPFVAKVFVGRQVEVGAQQIVYKDILSASERVEAEFEGFREGMILTERRIITLKSLSSQVNRVKISSFYWRSISAFSVEGYSNSDIELKLCGAGWGVLEIVMTKGTDLPSLCRLINQYIPV